MNTKSVLLRSLGVLLALLVYVALPSSVLADHGPCDDVYIELYYGTGTDLALELSVDNPTGATIFYTMTLNQPDNTDPTHNGATPGTGTSYFASGSKLHIPYGQTLYVRAIAWKSGWEDSVNVSAEDQHNPNE